MPPYIPKDSGLALLAKIPVIPARPRDLTRLYARLKALLDRSPRTKLLSVLKYAAYIVVFLGGLGSLPFVWHIRVVWHLFVPRLKYWAFCLTLVFASRKEQRRATTAWAENLSPIGAHPFELTTVYKRWASLDDIDMFGMHLSNSSYAKALDSARLKALVQCFPTWGRSGGHMPLGATHYHFIREIAPLARYEVRLTIGSWDHKWLYVVARYVTRPSRGHAHNLSPQYTSTPPTPTDSLTPDQNGYANVEHAVAAIINNTNNNGAGYMRRAPIVEPDGAILHCVAVSQMCFKWGRITTPPAVVLASEGFTKPYGDGDYVDVDNNASTGAGVHSYSYSRTNPPPNWIKSQSIRLPPHGSMDDFSAFLRGKWRDVPEGERWWEDALGGSIEAKRQANMEILDSLKLGLERTQTLH